MSFSKNKYKVVRNVISKELANFCYSYILNKNRVTQYLFQNNLISQHDTTFVQYNESQIPDTYCCYSDIAMETLLERILPVMLKETNLNLVPTYSYVRLYKYGDILSRHKDRPSCEISCTLNLGGDEWGIFIDPSGEQGNKGVQVNLKHGDMLIYRGYELEHWREQFEGNNCCQVFLHYNDIQGDFADENIYDKRPFLGLPNYCQKN